MDAYRMRRWAYGRLSRACAAAGARCPAIPTLNGLPMSKIMDMIAALEGAAGQLRFGEEGLTAESQKKDSPQSRRGAQRGKAPLDRTSASASALSA